MFVALQFPLTDARPFLHVDSHRLQSPTWPLPKPGTHFVRSCGPVKRRFRGGFKDWPGEEMYCSANRILRFEQPFTKIGEAGSLKQLKQYCAFRRFFSDGCATARLEVGLGYRREDKKSILSDKELLALISSVCKQKVMIRPGENSCTLMTAGKRLAGHYLQSSTEKSKENNTKPEAWWVSGGELMLLIEYQLDEIKSLPKYARHIQSPALMYALISLSHLWVDVNGRQLGVWLLGYSPADTNLDILRRLRLNLFRLHAEQESLRQMLPLIAQGKIEVKRGTPATERLQRYLQDSVSFLSKESREGLPQSEIRDAAEQAEGLVDEGERATLLDQLSDVRHNLLRGIEQLTQPTPNINQPIYNIGDIENTGELTIIIKPETTMNNQSMSITGSTVGDINQVAAQSIQNSFNKVAQSDAPQELKDKLDELNNAVTEMNKSLPENKQAQVAQDLKTLTDEALSEEPRQKWYELSAEGLIDAAKVVGEVAAPVVTAAKAVVALLAA